jgi:hypothetical protein
MLSLDPFTLDTVQLLENCSSLGTKQLADLDKFLEDNQKAIQSALLIGLSDEKDGHYVALKLLKLQSERLTIQSAVGLRRSTVQRPVEESRFMLAVVSQTFRTISEWMRVNNVDRITVESLPDLQHHITLEVLAQNGYSQIVDVRPQ